MRFILFMLSMLSLQSGLLSAQAATAEQLAAISRLGELNGVALQCRYTEQMQTIKRSLVLNLPKQRELGLWFEQSTNASFIDFMNKNAKCPDTLEYAQQVDQALVGLQSVFTK